jgi:succinate-semialdehyde dehydrogenase/glutarate-semialdehyde dehydrogenase
MEVMERLNQNPLLRCKAWIEGSWVGAASGACFDVRNPATGGLLAEVANLGESETRVAIDAAHRAWPVWSRQTAKHRAECLHVWADLIRGHSDHLAQLITLEQGKPLAEARQEVVYGASFLEWFAEEGRRVYGDIIPTVAPDRRFWVLKQAVGVCAAITPWNFPLAMMTRKVAPALAAGCTVVVKPAEETPLTGLALAALAHDANLPPGILNVVVGDRSAATRIGSVLCTHGAVRKLSFTGSTEVGRIVMRQSADTLKRLSLELGGHAAFLVFNDADIEAAVEGALQSKFRNAGQTCVSSQRFFVQDRVYEAFLEQLVMRARALKVGPGWEDGVQVGPLIHQSALDKVVAHVSDALERGARLDCGGTLDERGGLFFKPTVLSHVQASMRVAREEVFGPVLAVTRFDSEEKALALANRSDYGLAAYVYTRDVGRVIRVTEGLQVGMVAVNSGSISSEVVPFGGIKQSGFGREGSRYGIDEYLNLKLVCLGGV